MDELIEEFNLHRLIEEFNLHRLIEEFNLYRDSHPNLSQCWMSYLGLKKRHCDEVSLAAITHQCREILWKCENGCKDLEADDIVRLLLYKGSV